MPASEVVSGRWQEWIALGVVALVVVLLLEAPFRGIVLKRLSELLLRRGRVKWAMRLRRWSDPRRSRGYSQTAGTKKDEHCG